MFLSGMKRNQKLKLSPSSDLGCASQISTFLQIGEFPKSNIVAN